MRNSWAWADARRLPLILGGDLNLRSGLESGAERLSVAASSDVDHVLYGRPIQPQPATVAQLERGPLSDHVPLAVTLGI